MKYFIQSIQGKSPGFNNISKKSREALLTFSRDLKLSFDKCLEEDIRKNPNLENIDFKGFIGFLRGLRGRTTFERSFRISQNTHIYRLSCANNVMASDKGHPKVHFTD